MSREPPLADKVSPAVTPNVSREPTEATDALPGHTPETERALTEATPVDDLIALKGLEVTAAKQQRGA